MDQLATEQKKTGEEIQGLIRNFNKDSASRKTRSYYERRIRELSSAWDRFEGTDNLIRALETVPTDHAYFRTEYYQETSELVQKYLSIFENELAKIKDAESIISKDTNPRDTISPKEDHSSQLATMSRRQKAMITTIQRHLTTSTKEPVFETRTLIRDMITRLWNQIEDLHYSIQELGGDPGYDMESYIEIENMVRENIVKNTLVNQPHNNQFATNTNSSPVRLPKLTIPTFDGDYLKWNQFCDMFTQMVHNQPISVIQKMWYLKTNLSGEAEKLIRHLALTEANYESAWSLIKTRYNNTRVLTSAIISKIMSTPAITAETPTPSSVKNLHDTIREGLFALGNLGVDASTWDPLLLHFLVKKLDRQSHMLYEQSLAKPKENQSISAFLEFLEFRFQSLEVIGHKEKSTSARSLASTTVTSTTSDKRETSCIVCKQSAHPLFSCKSFLLMSATNRLQCAQKHKLCVNCLRPGHKASVCTLRACTKCNLKHNTLLHLDRTQETTIGREGTKSIQQDSKSSKSSSLAAASSHKRHSYILLGTARITARAHNGQSVTCRALLDSGSQINLITERLVRRLNLSPKRTALTIEGIGGSSSSISRRLQLEIESRVMKYSTSLEAFVLPEIVSKQPAQYMDITSWTIPPTISLADPTFNQPEHVDMLLGAEFYYQLLRAGQITLAKNMPVLQNTVFGWVISGKTDKTYLDSATCGVFTVDEALTNKLVERFWQLDEISDNQPILSVAEKRCESHFAQNTTRLPSGRFMVRLLFLDDPTVLGDSRKTAFNRLCALEKRLAKDSALDEMYKDFMKEYESLGHMTRIKASDIPEKHYVIPHHYVFKPDSTSTKLRVVFDASSKTSSGVSLNEVLHAGPTVQPELFTILLRFRLPTYVFTADIQKMYRQILIHPDDRRHQLVLWRHNSSQPARYYQLNTVTYGTRAAPYLATKCLQKLAEENHHRYPLGCAALGEHFYVDDGLVGSNSLSEAIKTQKQLTELLSHAGFSLRKWCANHRRLLDHIPTDHQEVNLDLDGFQGNSIKTLGLMWRPSDDQFLIRVNQAVSNVNITKRSVISELAKIFDPLGILSPIVVTAKMFIQKLWQLTCSWDDPLPLNLQQIWKSFRDDLKNLQNIHFHRHVFSQQTPKSIQIHVFADASEKAYGATMYIRSTLQCGTVVVRLLCAKSRVAPLKTQTLPRLELCAALVGVQLATRVRNDLRYGSLPTFFWTDSEIVLAWINSPSSSFQTFVANRVAKIHEGSSTSQWRHVRSGDNPADILSRGLSARRLASSNLWFYGPLFLRGNEALWPAATNKTIDQFASCSAELKQRPRGAAVTIATQLSDLIYNINHRNSFVTLQRIVAYMLRFAKHARQPQVNRCTHIALIPSELEASLASIVRTMQANNFKQDLEDLRKHQELRKGSSLSKLSPFIDENGIMRVGGRLKAANLPFDAKHQMLIPYNDPLVKLLMRSIHDQHFHCGPLALLAHTRQRFWPIKGKIMARSIVQHCVTCCKAKPTLLNQVMGNLPSTRVQPARPFVNTGVDFCGPIWVHYKVRGKKPQKAYVVVFCCFATKAVHLELATDLTTDAFIGSLQRFLGRRGHCKYIYCDNATNFVGARNKLAELELAVYAQPAQETIIKACSSKGIEFKFIPPRAPHFGGLWEAAVKSAKHLLIRSVSSASLTYEELETVIIGIEAVLNSRPICPMSSDPSDLTALTPGHFLIGEPLTAQIDATAQPNTSSLLRRWELVKRLKFDFWKRWSVEYLSELQQKQKWNVPRTDIQPGMMVIIKEDDRPIQDWPLGRIVKTFQGNDGMVRVAEVLTASGIRTRPIHRLAPLPVEDYFRSQNSQADPRDLPEPSNCPASRVHEEEHANVEEKPAHEVLKKRPRLAACPGMLTIVLALLLLPLIMASPVRITKFTQAPGMHFQDIGIVQPIVAEWNLITYYDVKPIWKGLTALHTGTDALKYLCALIQPNETCRPLTKQFDHIIAELELNEVLMAKTRPKRGAIDLVGNIAHSLFGILDTEYAQEMAKTINNVKANEEHLLSLFKNQTSILDATINIIKKDQAQIHETFGGLENQIHDIAHKVQEYDGQAYQQRLSQLVINLSLQLTLRASSLQRVQALLIDVLIDTHHGRLSPMLLSVSKLQREIQRIKSQLAPPFLLPISESDPVTLYKLMTIKSAATREYFIFNIKLPLIGQEQFQLLRLTPIPIVTNNTIVAIKPMTALLAMNHHRDKYLSMTSDTLRKCIQCTPNKFLCPNIQTTHNSESNYLSCEFNLFTNKSSSQCPFVKVIDDFVCERLEGENQWIFAFKNATKLNAVCGTLTFQLTLEKAGMIDVREPCSLRNSQINLQSYSIMSSTTNASYTIFTSNNISSNELVPSYLKLHNATHYTPKTDDLSMLQQSLRHQQEAELPKEVATSHHHGLAISYSTLGLLVIFAIIIFWKGSFQWTRRESRQKPIPRPRHHVDEDFTIDV